MSKAKRQYTALLMAAVLIFLPLAAHAEDAAAFQCEPGAGETVLLGDTIGYTLSINQDGTSKEWSALRVKLGEGMTLLTDSVLVKTAATENPLPAATSSSEPEKTAAGNVAEAAVQPEYEVVPGNDGFVVLFSSVRAGDVISFSAKVDSAQADVSVSAQTGDFSASVSHTLGKLPQVTVQPVQNAPAQPVAQSTSMQTIQWAVALLCVICLCLIGLLVYRRWGGALRRYKLFNWKWSAVMALFHPKKMAEATELTVSADEQAEECIVDEPERGGEAQEDQKIEIGSEQDVN